MGHCESKNEFKTSSKKNNINLQNMDLKSEKCQTPRQSQKSNTLHSPAKRTNFRLSSEVHRHSVKKDQKRSSKFLDSNDFPEKIAKQFYQNFKIHEEFDENNKTFKVNSSITMKEVLLKQVLFDQKNPRFTSELNSRKMHEILNHPHIQKLTDLFTSDDKLFVAYETSNKGFLDKIFQGKHMDEIKAAVIIYQLLSALCHLNKKKVMHRNIKFENILVSDYLIRNEYYYVKLTDFRNSKIYKENYNESELIGSTFLIAPEVIDNNYNEKCDIWTLGVIFYTLIEGKQPFFGASQEETFKKIKNNKITYSRRFSQSCIAFLDQLLNKDFNKRITSFQAFEHSYFEKIKIKEIIFDLDTETIIGILNKFNDEFFHLRSSFLVAFCSDVKITKSIYQRELLFNEIDRNKSDKISYSDIKFYSGLVGNISQITLDNLDRIFQNFEKENKKTINMNEFIQYTLDETIIIENADMIYNMLKFHYGSVSGRKLEKLFKHELKFVKKNSYNMEIDLGLKDFTEILEFLIK